MANYIQKDQKKRVSLQKKEVKRLLYKSMLNNAHISSEVKSLIAYKMNSLPRNSSLFKTKNRCIKTGRGKAVYSKFRLSRLSFRDLASFGNLPGVTKAYW